MDTMENWLQQIDLKEEEKDFFYRSPTTSINLEFFYISIHNKITKKEKLELTLDSTNKLTKHELIYLISSHKPQKYKLLDILVYQMTLPANELKYMDYYEGLQSIKSIEDIEFENVINYFKDLTTVYILFYEKNVNNSNTRKVHINYNHRNTKRIY